MGKEDKNHNSSEGQEGRQEKKGRKQLNIPKNTELVGDSGKVLSDVDTDMGCMIVLNDLDVPVGPLLQKCSHEHACETEDEAEEPD